MTNVTFPIPSVFTHEHLDRFLPSLVGFNRMWDTIDEAADIVNNSNTAFPQFNHIVLDENNKLIELAVAGYKQEEIDVTTEIVSKNGVKVNTLKVVGKKTEKDERKYIHKGIAGRSFNRLFILSDNTVVSDANLVDGILSIKLEDVVPEEQKPRKILINPDKA